MNFSSRRPLTTLLAITTACGLFTACSRQASTEPATVAPQAAAASAAPASQTSAVEAATAAVMTPAVAAAVSAGVADHGIAWRKPSTEAEVDQIFAESRANGRPVFLYWGAVWCPPCNQVKATVFKQAEFIEQSRAFLPVYLDGDLPGAQKLGARFKVQGYPTMILFRPDGAELTRLPGEVDAQKYLKVLAMGMTTATPVAGLLTKVRTEPGALSPTDWRMLAYYAWDTDEQQLVPQGQLPQLLQKLASACPPDFAEARHRLALMALVAQQQAEGPRKPVPRAAREQVLALLNDEAQTRENLDIVTSSAVPLTALLTAAGTPDRQKLSTTWAATLDRVLADERLSPGDRVEALIARVGLGRLDAGIPDKALVPANKPLSPALLQQVKSEAARFDTQVTSDLERQSVITSVAHALQQAGLLAESDKLLEAELERSHSPYYAMLSLASNAKLRGDKVAALDWYERAYKESKGASTRVQWGSGYVNALVELSPEDSTRIGAAASSVLGELKDQPDAFYERTARSLNRMSGKLVGWARTPSGVQVLAELRSQRDALCAALPPADAQRATCEALLQPPSKSATPAGKKPAARA